MTMRVLLAAVLVSSLGCNGDSVPTESVEMNPVVGNYFLQSVDGAPLPFVYQEGVNDKSETVQNELLIHRSLAFQSTQTNRLTQSGSSKVVTANASGYVVVSGKTVTFNNVSTGATSVGTLDGNWLTHVSGAHTMKYWKIQGCNLVLGTITPCE